MSGAAPIVVDARGMRCPWPVLRLARTIRERGAVPLRLLADDPRAPAELASFAATQGWEVVEAAADDHRAFDLAPITRP
jgi:tRNA 2-thiouridine synthesizing protein A